MDITYEIDESLSILIKRGSEIVSAQSVNPRTGSPFTTLTEADTWAKSMVVNLTVPEDYTSPTIGATAE